MKVAFVGVFISSIYGLMGLHASHKKQGTQSIEREEVQRRNHSGFPFFAQIWPKEPRFFFVYCFDSSRDAGFKELHYLSWNNFSFRPHSLHLSGSTSKNETRAFTIYLMVNGASTYKINPWKRHAHSCAPTEMMLSSLGSVLRKKI